MSTTTPSLSIIIVTYNSRRCILDCIDSALESDKEGQVLEVLVVDNGSTDGSVDAIKRRFANEPRIKLNSLNNNLGFAKANNIGFKLARGQYCVLLNDDTIVQNGYFEASIKILEENDSIIAVQPKLLHRKRPSILDSAGCFIDRFGFTYERGCGEIDKGQYDEETEIFYAKGAALLLNRSRLSKHEATLFDDDYFMYHEDVDLCWRLRLAGWRIVYSPKSEVLHLGRAQNRGDVNPQLVFHHEKNRLLTLIKNYSLTNLMLGATFLVLSEAFLVLHFLSQNKVAKAKAVILSVLWNIFNVRSSLAKRALVQCYRRVPDAAILQAMMKFDPLRQIKNLEASY